MGRSYKRDSDRKYRDDYEAYSKNEVEYRLHKKEKRLSAAIKTMDLEALIEDDEDEEE